MVMASAMPGKVVSHQASLQEQLALLQQEAPARMRGIAEAEKAQEGFRP